MDKNPKLFVYQRHNCQQVYAERLSFISADMNKAERIRTIIGVNYVFVIHKIRSVIYNMDGKQRDIYHAK